MITDFFTGETKKVKKYDYFELHTSFLGKKMFKSVLRDVKPFLVSNSTRESCVCMTDDNKDNNYIQYNLPRVAWEHVPSIKKIKNNILEAHEHNPIDYGLVHLYKNEKSVINWHSDREALRSYIYSISLGGARKFCLRDKLTMEEFHFTLYDGDLFIMKPGCQDRYEHCIKSVKALSEPRISITFRQIETPDCFYVLDRDTMEVGITRDINLETTQYITHMRHCVQLCLKIDDYPKLVDDYPKLLEHPNTKKNTSLLKSNLQKAIRRNEKQVALDTALYMMKNNMMIDLLRRLTIITFEDVSIDKYYPTIVWYCTVFTQKGIEAITMRDIQFIYSYVGLLCDIEIKTPPHYDDTIEAAFGSMCGNPYATSLYLRSLFGGFAGEKKMMHQLINNILDSKIQIVERKLEWLDFDFETSPNVRFLDCAIDFHCFPRMIQQVSRHLNKKAKLTQDDIKDYIWTFDSRINYRVPLLNADVCEERRDTWHYVVKPECDKFRNFIQKLI